MNPQAVPSHVAEPFVGTVHGVQLVPQELTLESLEHRPLQSCVPLAAQTPEQGD